MDFYTHLPPEMLRVVIDQRLRDIVPQGGSGRRPVAARPRRRMHAVRAVARLRRLIAASGGSH